MDSTCFRWWLSNHQLHRERKERTPTRWMKAHKGELPAKELTLKVEGLIEGKEYEFHVAAINKAGQGPFSEPSEPRLAKPPYDVPEAPGKPEVSNIDATQMTVSWTPPESDGGSPITGYYVERKDTTSSKWVKVNKTPVKETTLRVKDLTERAEYQFRVSAENKAGVGPASEPSDVFMAKPPYDVPGKPDRPDITEVDRTHISISWSPPESDGGSPITNYLIERKDTTSTRWIKVTKETVIDTEYTIRDLTEGQTYEFRVAAVNKAGPGPFSEPPEPKTCKPPYDVPEAPGRPDVTEVDAEHMVITWTPPASRWRFSYYSLCC
ncbi:myomesin-3-like [Amphiura filiformis]|uniref:myomesin-3-like n=1 Tax=Amphiura filiformis TaxID=82378 RepID=UPI003B215BF7